MTPALATSRPPEVPAPCRWCGRPGEVKVDAEPFGTPCLADLADRAADEDARGAGGGRLRETADRARALADRIDPSEEVTPNVPR